MIMTGAPSRTLGTGGVLAALGLSLLLLPINPTWAQKSETANVDTARGGVGKPDEQPTAEQAGEPKASTITSSPRPEVPAAKQRVRLLLKQAREAAPTRRLSTGKK